jgi:hypothetical protein
VRRDDVAARCAWAAASNEPPKAAVSHESTTKKCACWIASGASA